MKKSVLTILCLFMVIPAFGSTQKKGYIVAWGSNKSGQSNAPAGDDFVAVAAGGHHSLALKRNGSIVAWGNNSEGQCTVPSPNTDFVAISAGYHHSLGLKSDGSIVAWGWNEQGQCNVPAPNTDFIAVSGGVEHSLGLKSDGSIVAWGRNCHGQCNVPAPNTDFIAISGGRLGSIGLKTDGSIVAWGNNSMGECDVPLPNTDFVAIEAGYHHSLGLKSDGSIVAWGYNRYGQCDVPLPNTGFTAVVGGGYCSLAIKTDGSVLAWGDNLRGACNVPSPNTEFVAIDSAGYLGAHSLGLKADIVYNLPPIAVAGPDQTAYAWIDGIADVNLDGSASYDDDGDELTYLWSWQIGSNIYEANGVNPIIELPVGQHLIELVVNDGIEDSEPNYTTVTVIEPLQAKLWIMPRVINKKSHGRYIIAWLQLPPLITEDDIEDGYPLTMYPGQIEAARKFMFTNLRKGLYRTNILAFFDRRDLIDAAGDDERIWLDVVGKLTTGQYFYAQRRTLIINRGRRPWHH